MNRTKPYGTFSGSVLLGTFVPLLALVTGCGSSMSASSDLAKAGKIDPVAPVRADVQTTISARPETIWKLLVDVRNWTAWNPDIQQVAATGPLQRGMSFAWKTGGISITSRVELAETNRRLAWTGTAFTARAVHLWELRSGPGGQTLVRVQESIEGPFMAHFLSSTELADADKQWLAALKIAAEQQP